MTYDADKYYIRLKKERHCVRHYSMKRIAFDLMLPYFVTSNEKLKIFMDLVRMLEALDIDPILFEEK